LNACALQSYVGARYDALIGEDGGRVRRRRGRNTVDGSLDELRRRSTLVCSGITCRLSDLRDCWAATRRGPQGHDGRVAVSLAFTLAGRLLDGKKATSHWENQDSFSEDFEM